MDYTNQDLMEAIAILDQRINQRLDIIDKSLKRPEEKVESIALEFPSPLETRDIKKARIPWVQSLGGISVGDKIRFPSMSPIISQLWGSTGIVTKIHAELGDIYCRMENGVVCAGQVEDVEVLEKVDNPA